MIDENSKEQYNEFWKTKSAYYAWLRGQLRRIWSRYPIKNIFKRDSCRPATDDDRIKYNLGNRVRNIGECVMCKGMFPSSKLEVDHIFGNVPCSTKEEAENFLWHCAGAKATDMQLICVPCHKIKTYSEKMDVSFTQAKVMKESIAFSKLNFSAQHLLLESLGLELGKSRAKNKQIYDTFLSNL